MMTPLFGWRVDTEKLQAGDRVRASRDSLRFTIIRIDEVKENGFRDALIVFEPRKWLDGSPRETSLPVALGYVVDTREEFDAISAR
jgi:hypothetical protein